MSETSPQNPLMKEISILGLEPPRTEPTEDINFRQANRAIEQAKALGGGINREVTDEPPWSSGIGQEAWNNMSEEEKLEALRKEREKGAGFREILLISDNPDDIRIASRMYWGVYEEDPDTATSYVTNADRLALRTRMRKADPLFNIPEENRKRMKLPGKDENPELTKALKETVDEFEARATLLGLFQIQESVKSDSGTYMNKLFISNRPKVEAVHYRTIGNLEKTPGAKEKFGVYVSRAINGWLDIAEGKPDAIAAGLLPPWSSKEYQDNYDNCKQYIADKYTDGDLSAVRLAEILLKHWDVHASYAVHGQRIPDSKIQEILETIGLPDSDGSYVLKTQKDLATNRKEESFDPKAGVMVPDKLELMDSSTNDTAKPVNIGLRQLLEYAGKDHPRAVSPPSTVGCFPSITSDMLHMLAVEENGNFVTFFDMLRNYGIGLGDMPWDQVKGTWTDKNGITHNTSGIEKHANYVPYGLQKFYADAVWEFAMRRDYSTAGGPKGGILDPETLIKLNKPFELAFAIRYGASLDKDLVPVLRQFAKVTGLAGIAIACTYGPFSLFRRGKDGIIELSKTPFVPSEAIYKDRGVYVEKVLGVAERSEFFSVRQNMEAKRDGGDSMLEKERELFRYLVNKRMMGVKPSMLVNPRRHGMDIKPWFTQPQIDQLNKAGAFYPFTA